MLCHHQHVGGQQAPQSQNWCKKLLPFWWPRTYFSEATLKPEKQWSLSFEKTLWPVRAVLLEHHEADTEAPGTHREHADSYLRLGQHSPARRAAPCPHVFLG